VICDRCGRSNPDNLAFCQDCGRRLVSQAAVVPPTPPTGLGIVPIPAEQAAEAPPASRMSRPEAPTFSFDSPLDQGEGAPCPMCSARNPPGNRFCVACGARFPPINAGAAVAVAQPSPIVNAAAQIMATSPSRIVCSRCNGASDSDMQYCQFCGASLRQEALRAGPPNHEQPVTTTTRPEELRPIGSDGFAARAAGPDAFGARPGAPEIIAPAQPPRAGARGAATSPTGAAASRLVTIARDGAEGATYPLTGDQVDLGRDEGNILLRDDAYISPRHLRLLRRNDGWYARDLGSLNGVYLRLRRPQQLSDGDLLLIGLQVLRFEAVRDAEQGFGPATQHGTLLFGSPMLPRYARLCERTVEGVTRNVFYLHRDETIIGRESGDIVFTDDPFMSRRHVAIRLDSATATFTATDLGSSNGTYIAIRGEIPLGHGDFLRIGQHLFRVELAASGPPPGGGSPAGGARRGS
jgi:pSer/pThr/pTyr-binding forkhead associated (FHA) protein